MKVVRMDLPFLGGPQNVREEDVAMFEKRGGVVLPDLTADEVAAQKAAADADARSLATAISAQKAADDLRAADEAKQAEKEKNATAAPAATAEPDAKPAPAKPAKPAPVNEK
ncbi:MAG: hypothetical protein ACO1Q7_15925 [Gemmatimonas sp.]